jgi:hypothetical protein
MAMVFSNISKCPICGEVLNENKEYTMFPPFISNIKDPMFMFGDSGIHLSCLNNHPMGKKALLFREKFHEIKPSVNSKCLLDGNPIIDPRDIFIIGLLTSNEEEELFKYNFLVFNRKNIGKWKDRDIFLKAVARYKEENKWESFSPDYNYLDNLVNKIIENS